MNIAILGTGSVGQTLAARLIELGHQVCMGSRTSDNEKALAFARAHTPKSRSGTFADAAAFGDLVLNCTRGEASLAALEAAGAANLNGKVLIDVANPLDFSRGFPPSMLTASTDSLAEQLQRAFPQVKVVKSLNTVNAAIMANPQRLASGNHDMFLCGNDASAKGQVRELLQTFGWKNILDVGDLTAARAMEMHLMLWVRLYGTLQTAEFNIKVIR